MIEYRTKNCVICYSPDTVLIGGHVHDGDETIFAHFCEEHMDIESKLECTGCYGYYVREMGKEDSGINFGYIDTEGFHEEE